MRMTTFSVAATVLMAAAIATFWPGRNAGPGAAIVVAQNKKPADPLTPPGPFSGNVAATAYKLDDSMAKAVISRGPLAASSRANEPAMST